MMAFTTFIMTVLLVTIADANFPDWAQNNFEQFDPLFKSSFQNTIKPLKLKPFSPFKFKPFEPITFKPFSFKPIEAIDPDMIRNYVPGEGENFIAQSFSTSSFSKNINGVKSEGARGSSIINDNGNVNADDVGYYKADPNPETEDN